MTRDISSVALLYTAAPKPSEQQMSSQSQMRPGYRDSERKEVVNKVV